MPNEEEARLGFKCPKAQPNDRCARLDALADEYDALEQQHLANVAA